VKISVIGYSASGKSTFSKKLAQHYNIPKLHIDTIYFKASMEIQDKLDTEHKIRTFMTQNDWIIDGTYRFLVQERYDVCDQLFIFDFNRFKSFSGLIRRYFKYRNKQRDTMAIGNPEKLDFSFIKWILWDGRKKNSKELFKSIALKYPHKVVVFKNRKQVRQYLRQIEFKGSLDYID
jgi:adenylate kinase family enzyme